MEDVHLLVKRGTILLINIQPSHLKFPSRHRCSQLRILSICLAICAAIFLIGCNPGDLGKAVKGWTPIAMDYTTSIIYTVDQTGHVIAVQDQGFEGPKLLWSYPPGKEDNLKGSYQAPVIFEDNILVAGINGHIYSFNKTNHSLSDHGWKQPQSIGTDLPRIFTGVAVDPVNNKAYAGSDDGSMSSYELFTGKPHNWEGFQLDDKIWSTPLVHEGNLYFGAHNNNFYSVDGITGEIQWTFATDGAIPGSPIITEDLVIFGSMDRQLYALEHRTGTIRWTFEASNWFWAPPVVKGSTIYAASVDGVVHALDKNGNELWNYDHKEQIIASPAVTPSGLVIVSVDGKLTLLDPTPQDLGESRIKSTLELSEKGIKAQILSNEEYIYVSSQSNNLYKIRVSNSGFEKNWCYDLEEKSVCE